MTTFFIPGAGNDPHVVERAYVETRWEVEPRRWVAARRFLTQHLRVALWNS